MAERDYIVEQHRPFIKDLYGDTLARKTTVKIGDILVFMYENERRYVFVVTPLFLGKLHGLDMRRVPRKQFMYVANLSFNRLTSKSFYRTYISRHWMAEFEAYRTYDWKKIVNPRYIDYDRNVQPDEKGTAKIPDPAEDADGIIL